MAMLGKWTGALFIGAVWWIFLAVKIPREGGAGGGKSRKLWAGSVISALAMGMTVPFGLDVVRGPLALIFVPSFVTGMILYAWPLSGPRESTLRWALGWVLGLLGLGMLAVFDKRSLERPLIFITLPSFAGAVLLHSYRKTPDTKPEN